MGKATIEPEINYSYEGKNEAALEQVLIDLIEQSYAEASA